MEALREHLSAARLWLSGALSFLWSWFLSHVAPMYVDVSATVPLTAVLVFWTLDMVAGSARAIQAGGLRAWSPTRAKLGVAKLVLWCLTLAATYLLRKSGALGGSALASIVESYILITEFGSVLKNLGRAWKHRGIEAAGELAEGRAGGIFGKRGESQ